MADGPRNYRRSASPRKPVDSDAAHACVDTRMPQRDKIERRATPGSPAAARSPSWRTWPSTSARGTRSPVA
eukprot:9474536-Pyramimonas_sp.AAC.1